MNSIFDTTFSDFTDALSNGTGAITDAIGKVFSNPVNTDPARRKGQATDDPGALNLNYNNYHPIQDFFHATGAGFMPGNEFTRSLANDGNPDKHPSKAVTSTNPTDFYAHWYNRMREFAQAEAIADRGQGQVRSR